MLLSVYLYCFSSRSQYIHISFSDYRWQCLYCLLFNDVTVGWELLGGVVEMRAYLERWKKKLYFENIFLQTKKN